MSGLITRKELHASLVSELDSVKDYIDGSNNEEMGAHMNSTSNPHSVTKSQVGLGNVSNVLQATKAEFDAFVARRDNPHGVTVAQVGGVPPGRTISAGTGLTGGGNLTANRSLALNVAYTDDRYLRRTATAVNASALSGYGHSSFLKVGSTFLDMGASNGIYRSGNTLYAREGGNNRRIYHSGNIRYGTASPSGGVNGDIYIQY
jgi:hypothetical protein